MFYSLTADEPVHAVRGVINTPPPAEASEASRENEYLRAFVVPAFR